MNEIYLDNSATTKPRDEVINEMVQMMKFNYGNPSSLHSMGFKVEKKIKMSRSIISKYLNVGLNEVFFTSGGTESNNIAIQGIIKKQCKYGKHIITTKIEHPSVLNIFKNYERKGYKVTYLNVDRKGLINLNELEESIKSDTILVAIILVNNEIGTIQPIKKIKDIIYNTNKNVKLHVDAVQGFGKINIDIKNNDIHTMSFSSHKVNGPKGVAGLYVEENLDIEPIIYGGNQERGIRSGTENTTGIVGFGKAVSILRNNFEFEKDKVIELKNYFIKRVRKEINNISINSFLDERCVPHIVNISFEHIKAEVLLHYLEMNNIYVSTGSACSSKLDSYSYVLKAIDIDDRYLSGAIRFSFSYLNTKKQIDYVVSNLVKSVNEIRKITKR